MVSSGYGYEVYEYSDFAYSNDTSATSIPVYAKSITGWSKSNSATVTDVRYKIYRKNSTSTSCWGDAWTSGSWGTAYDNCFSHWNYYEDRKLKPKPIGDRLRDILHQRSSPAIIIGSRKPIQLTTRETEIRARETLRRVIGDEKYRDFLRNGFVTVRAKSGMVYQIFPDHHFTNVYRDGAMVERLCVVFRGNFPPTDSLIMRYLLILNDEADFRSHANVYSASPRAKTVVRAADCRSLPEIYRELRVAG